MQPNNLAQTQQALAQAVRLASPEPLGGYAPNRLAVYARLVRNNTFGFIDRCYVLAPQHLTASTWLEVKERFLQQGKATSPYFQDIAGEFLQFCREGKIFNRKILALMDFEHTQLLAEVATAKVPEQFDWQHDTPMQLSGAAFLKEYEFNFVTSKFKRFSPKPTALLVWRDSQFGVYEQILSELDFWLLSYLHEQPSSLNEILLALDDMVEDSETLRPVLTQTWTKWVNADVIYPVGI